MAKPDVSPYDLGAMTEEEMVGLFGPSNTLDLMNQIKAQADQIDATVRTSSEIRQEVRDAWNAFYKGWAEFYKNITDSWISTLKLSLNETMDQAQSYKTKVDDWRTAIEKESGSKLAGPRITEGEESIPWKPILYVGLGIGAIVAIGYTVGSFRGMFARGAEE